MSHLSAFLGRVQVQGVESGRLNIRPVDKHIVGKQQHWSLRIAALIPIEDAFQCPKAAITPSDFEHKLGTN